MTGDGLELYFGTNRLGHGEMHVSKRSSTSEPFTTVSTSGLENVNTIGREGNPSISSDGLELYFVTGKERAPVTLELEQFDLWFAKRSSRNESFGVPERMAQFSTDTIDNNPSVSGDGLSLYFSHYDNNNELNIYVATRNSKNDPWGPAARLPREVITLAYHEDGAKVSSDELSLFFVSERAQTRGGTDIYVATRASTSDPWLQSVNLGDVINTVGFDQWPFYSPERQELLFVRSQGDLNNDTRDIYRSSLLPFEYASVSGSGGVYSQDFNGLGTDSQSTGIAFPNGWTSTSNDVVFQNATSMAFPGRRRNYAGFYNAGDSNDPDRTLATSRTIGSRTVPAESGEFDFRAQVDGQPAKALRLSFDVEAWGATASTAASPGEAAFDVTLEADTGNGFQPLMMFGSASTGATLQPPVDRPGTVNGNDPAYRTSFDTGVKDIDIPVGAKLRFRWIQPETAASTGWIFGLDNMRLVFAQPGDADGDGLFNSTDLVKVFQAGEFEDGVTGNSTWSDGDWTGDKEFASDDLVAAFQAGNYEAAQVAVASVPEPMLSFWLTIVFVGVACRRRRRCPIMSSRCLVVINSVLVPVSLAVMLGMPCNTFGQQRFLLGKATLVPEVNTEGMGEYAPSLTADGLELFFTQAATTQIDNSGIIGDLFVSRRDSKDKPFGPGVPLDSINRANIFEGQSSISGDGLTIYFARRTDPTIDVRDIWTASRSTRNDPFGPPSLLIASPNGKDWVLAPHISADGLSLYMQYGHYFAVDDIESDIYVSRRESSGHSWGELMPVAELAKPNTYHGRPSVSADNLTLFFKQFDSPVNREPGQSTGDLIMMRRSAIDQPWSNPINLGSSINSTDDEAFANLTADGKTL
jgi:Tol biopolymer transport system component